MIKAIETQYKGYRFRSRLEARWAVVFDALGLEWAYEPEGYDLGGGVRYLPDFYTPYFGTDGAYIEIKANMESFRSDFAKCQGLASQQERHVIVLYDLPSQTPWGTYGLMLGSRDQEGGVFAFAYTEYLFAYTSNDHLALLWRNPNEQFIVGTNSSNSGKFWVNTFRMFRPMIEHPHIVSAFQAGVQARFEHGENGAR